ncbi:MAG: AsnC family transcriptional regulator [Nanoarchaeota archaeon]|nr:AsnC family transcriptional regulator [Nanoarchaeota archaeon]
MQKIKLDAYDRKLLSALDMDARQPASSLGKNLRMSRSTVEYRMHRLEKLGVIKGYYAVCDQTRLGFHIYRLTLKFRDMDIEKESQIYEHCKKENSIVWAAKLEGPWDFVAVILAKDPYKYKEVERELMFKFGHHVKEHNASISLKIMHKPHNYLYTKQNNSSIIIGDSPGHLTIDNIDQIIVSELTSNARIPLIDLSRKIKLTSNAIASRISALERKGIIKGYRPVIDISLMGFQHYKTYLSLANLDHQKFRSIVSYLAALTNVVYITEAFSEGDLEFESQVERSSELYDLIRDLSASFRGAVKDYYVLLSFKTLDLGNKQSSSFTIN